MLEGRDIAMTAEDRRITYSSLTEVICLGIEPMLGELADNWLFGGFCGRDSGIGPAQRAKTTIWN